MLSLTTHSNLQIVNGSLANSWKGFQLSPQPSYDHEHLTSYRNLYSPPPQPPPFFGWWWNPILACHTILVDFSASHQPNGKSIWDVAMARYFQWYIIRAIPSSRRPQSVFHVLEPQKSLKGLSPWHILAFTRLPLVHTYIFINHDSPKTPWLIMARSPWWLVPLLRTYASAIHFCSPLKMFQTKTCDKIRDAHIF